MRHVLFVSLSRDKEKNIIQQDQHIHTFKPYHSSEINRSRGQKMPLRSKLKEKKTFLPVPKDYRINFKNKSGDIYTIKTIILPFFS